MQVKDILDTARYDYLDDVEAARFEWDDSSMLRKINEAQRQACSRANLIYEDTLTEHSRITLVAGQASYALSPKVTVIENVIFDGNVLEKKTPHELDRSQPTWRTDTGMLDKTVYYTVRGRNIRFSRVPDASDAGQYVSLEVYRLPDADIVSTSEEPEIPEEHHLDLIYYVLHLCYKKQDADTYNQERSDYFLNRFTEIFGPAVSARVRQHQFESPNVLSFIPESYNGASIEEDEDW